MAHRVIHRETVEEISHAKRNGSMMTDNGPRRFWKGDFILTNEDGDQYPIRPWKLKARYRRADEKTGQWIKSCLEWNKRNGIE